MSSKRYRIDGLQVDSSIPCCIVCNQAAAGLGPYSRHYLCQIHLAIDVEQVQQLSRDVREELRHYLRDGVASAFAIHQRQLTELLNEMQQRFVEMEQLLNVWKDRIIKQLIAQQKQVQKCLSICEDLKKYNRQVREAEAMGNLVAVRDLAHGMQATLPELKADFELAQRSRSDGDELVLRRLRRLHGQMVTSLTSDAIDAAVTARPETSDVALMPEEEAATRSRDVECQDQFECLDSARVQSDNSGQIVISHELKLNSVVDWVTVCRDTREFRSDRSGRIVPAELAGADTEALPQPCLVVVAEFGSNHLTVLSLDGTARLRCDCDNVDWENSVCGLHCGNKQLFVAQEAVVIVIDLSGRTIRRIIPPGTDGFYFISGIGGNTDSILLTSDNKIAVTSQAGELATLIALPQPSNARLQNLTIHKKCIFVTDRQHDKVYQVRLDTPQLTTSHPTSETTLSRFKGPRDVAVDSRGRVFVSEFEGHSVRALSAGNGALLWTIGVPGRSGSGSNRLNGPRGLAVVMTGDEGSCEQLVVADCWNKRLLVLNLL